MIGNTITNNAPNYESQSHSSCDDIILKSSTQSQSSRIRATTLLLVCISSRVFFFLLFFSPVSFFATIIFRHSIDPVTNDGIIVVKSIIVEFHDTCISTMNNCMANVNIMQKIRLTLSLSIRLHRSIMSEVLPAFIANATSNLSSKRTVAALWKTIETCNKTIEPRIKILNRCIASIKFRGLENQFLIFFHFNFLGTISGVNSYGNFGCVKNVSAPFQGDRGANHRVYEIMWSKNRSFVRSREK